MPAKQRKDIAAKAAAINGRIRKLSMMWKAFEALWRDDGPAASGWVSLADSETKIGMVRVLRLKARKSIAAAYNVPTLILDALLQPELLEPFWPQVTVTADVRAQAPHQRIRQVIDCSYSKRRMAHPKHLRDLHAIICREARRVGPQRVLVVVQKEIEVKLPNCGPLPVNIELAHHNDIAGRDEWGPGPDRPGVGLLIVVGRTACPPVGVERQAEALTGKAVTPLPGWYAKADATREMADGTTQPSAADQHPDAVGEAIRWQIAEGELVQIIGRARGVNRGPTNPAHILLMTDAPVPVPVLETITAAELDPSPIDLMLAKGGVALANPIDAATAYPDLWNSPVAAKQALWRSKKSQSRINNYLSDFVTICTARYRLAAPGRYASTVWYDPNLVPDPAVWLTNRLGPLKSVTVGGMPEALRPDPAAMSDADKLAMRKRLQAGYTAPSADPAVLVEPEGYGAELVPGDLFQPGQAVAPSVGFWKVKRPRREPLEVMELLGDPIWTTPMIDVGDENAFVTLYSDAPKHMEAGVPKPHRGAVA
jgi:putative DNA primase/helicase